MEIGNKYEDFGNLEVKNIIKAIDCWESSIEGYSTEKELFTKIYQIVSPKVEQFNAEYQVENYLNQSYDFGGIGLKDVDGGNFDDDLSDEDYEDEEPIACKNNCEWCEETVKSDEGDIIDEDVLGNRKFVCFDCIENYIKHNEWN